jgi:hypothetical protein
MPPLLLGKVSESPTAAFLLLLPPPLTPPLPLAPPGAALPTAPAPSGPRSATAAPAAPSSAASSAPRPNGASSAAPSGVGPPPPPAAILSPLIGARAAAAGGGSVKRRGATLWSACARVVGQPSGCKASIGRDVLYARSQHAPPAAHEACVLHIESGCHKHMHCIDGVDLWPYGKPPPHSTPRQL